MTLILPQSLMVLCLAPVIGSWLGVIVRRWPQGGKLAWSRSACETCGHALGPLDLVPLASFAWARGRCRYCGTGIGWFHPAIEILCIIIAAAVAFTDGDGWPLWVDSGLGWALLAAAWIDAETFRLPDMITLPLTLAGLAVTWFGKPSALYAHAAAAAAGYGGFRMLNFLYRTARHRDGLGAGDAKLLAAAGAWLGLAALPYVVMGAGLFGIALAVLSGQLGGARRGQPIAFGPALALSFFLWRLAVNRGGCF